MIDQQKLQVFKELFSQADSVLIIYAPDALRDHLFAATALYKTFQQLGNKDVALLSSESLHTAEPDIVYLDETRTEIGHKNLCITLDYNTDSVEKITSSIDEEAKKLHLTIKPKKGISPLSQENVSFSYTGAEADMVILVGVDDLESLEQLYHGYENVYQTTALVSLNSYETSFGNLKLDIMGSSCVSEYVASMIRGLNYQLDAEVATNLLAGIDEETDNLESYLATADTFELVSYLLRSGARRFARDDQSGDIDSDDSDYDSEEIFTANTQDQEVGADDVLLIEEQQAELEQEVAAAVQPPQPQTKSELKQTVKPKKKKRGRPKGSKNKPKNGSKQSNQSKKNSKNAPKPGDLDYVPSGLGPSAT